MIDDVARAALLYWAREDAIVMVAVAGAESGYQPEARGDHYSNFPPAEQPVYLQYSWEGYTSFGPWQVNTRWHWPELEIWTGSTDPAVWAAWLFDVLNNARAAFAIWESQGFSAWSTFNLGSYRAHLEEAREAVDRAQGDYARVGVEPPLQAVDPPLAEVDVSNLVPVEAP